MQGEKPITETVIPLDNIQVSEKDQISLTMSTSLMESERCLTDFDENP